MILFTPKQRKLCKEFEKRAMEVILTDQFNQVMSEFETFKLEIGL